MSLEAGILQETCFTMISTLEKPNWKNSWFSRQKWLFFVLWRECCGTSDSSRIVGQQPPRCFGLLFNFTKTPRVMNLHDLCSLIDGDGSKNFRTRWVEVTVWFNQKIRIWVFHLAPGASHTSNDCLLGDKVTKIWRVKNRLFFFTFVCTVVLKYCKMLHFTRSDEMTHQTR